MKNIYILPLILFFIYSCVDQSKEQKVNMNKNGLKKYYHENGEIRKEVNYKDGKIDGFYITYYDNGQLESKIEIKDGLKQGLSSIYYRNGQLESKIIYKNDEPDGPYNIYYENGEINEQGVFENGGTSLLLIIKDGQFVNHTMSFEDGTKESQVPSDTDQDQLP